MHLVFYPATQDDMPVLLGLIQQLYAHEGIRYEPVLIEGAVRNLWEDRSQGQIWLMKAGETLVGYCVLTFVFVLEFAGRCAVIDELFIVPDQQGKGFGTQALHWVEAACRRDGCKAIRLEVEHDNRLARRTYLKAGFQPHDRSIMTKPLRNQDNCETAFVKL